ncbi:beta-mannosidase [Neiella marina]|uniref:Beta-mannosidase n=1 Tax=Neiella marina TaxID=508461 RepID=A0A8J2U247_9GAMM|nr:cellulase family glycosylhydrolase [Neiella marina]GGA64945.1 beta-mannosidase [Neiella marina]
MKKITQSALALCALSLSSAACAGFYVSGGDLYDGNGNKFVMRGINHAHTWYTSQLDGAMSGIANTGSNTVRVVLSNGHRWTYNGASDIRNIIQKAKAEKLVAVLEVHDTTGYGEDSAAATLASAVDYWISMKNELVGEEDYVIINIGNEPFGNGQSASAWIDGHKAAITRLRNAGFSHTLMVDAPNWGQDWQNVMRDNAQTVFNADPDKNVVFSVHMYEVYNSYNTINNYMTSFANNGMPLVVGEFASTHKGSNVDEASIMERAETLGVGYLGWSWSGNDASTADLDIVNNWNANSLSGWGNTLVNGSNGISSTSVLAGVYTGQSGGGSGGGSGDYPTCSSAAVDPDGDGWGWENNQSCIVVAGGNAPNGFPYCADASNDPDGDGWGWENSASCVVRGSAADY